MKVIIKTIQWSVFVLLVFQTAVFAQIKVGDNPTVLNPSAMMEIESVNKGFLLPRLQLASATQATPLSQHVAGMIVYNTAAATGLTPGFYYNDGTKWVGISQSTATGLLSADNGLTNVAGVAKLGGSLTQPTVLTTTAINTFAINGLSVGDTSQGDFVIIDKVTGVLKTIPYSVIEEAINKKLDGNPIIAAGTNTKITYDAKGLVTKSESAAVQDILGLQTELDKKAPLDSPVFTGAAKTTPINETSSADAIANKSYVDDAVTAANPSIVSQTITDGQTTTAPSENAVHDTLITKADITYVDTQNALKADKTYVDTQDALKADKSYVDSQDALKADKTYVDSQNALKADKTYVDAQDALKADKTYVDAQDALKADKAYVDSQNTLKADKTYVDTQDALKADKAYVDNQVALKADKTYVDTQDALKADKTYVDTQDALKADKIYVDNQDALKADKTYVDSRDALKADKTYVDAQDVLKADKTYVDTQDALKADKTYVDAQDALKVNKTYVDSQDALKADKTYVDSQDVLKADKTYVDSQDALKADKTYVDSQDALKADITYVDSQISSVGNIYTKDGTLTDNRKITLDDKNLEVIGSTAANPTRLAPDGTMTVGGNVNINNKVAGTNAPINSLQFTNDENGAGYSAASITAQTGDDKAKGQLSFKVKTATGVDTEAARITDKGNVLVGGTTDNNYAVLNVQSTTKGVLMPRQTETQRNAINSAAPEGLLVYQTDNTSTSQKGQYLKTSTGWSRMLLEGEIKQDYFEAKNTSGVTISGSTTVPIAVHITGIDNATNAKNIDISDPATTAKARFDGVVIDNVLPGGTCKVYLRYISVNNNTSALTQNAFIFLNTGGTFTNDPSSLPFGVDVGKVLNISPTEGAILFTVYPVTDFFRNQYEKINGTTDETVFTGRVVSSLEPLDDTYLTNKKYVDEAVAFAQLYQGAWNAATNTPPLEGLGIAQRGWARDVTVASGAVVNYSNMCAATNILKGDVIKFDGTCWVVLEKQYPSATTTQEGMVKLDAAISSSTSLVPSSNLVKAVSDANQSHIANVSNPHSVTKAQVGLSNVDNTSDANKPVSLPQQTALDLKAEKSYVDSLNALKADKTYVDSQDALKADKTYVDSQNALKADKTYVDSQDALKADKTYVDSQNALKADKTYVDSQDALKADKTYVDAQNALKADKTYVDAQNALKADKTYVDSQDALKADKSYVDAQDAKKANITYVNAIVEDQIIDGSANKAPSQNSVFDALSKKADSNLAIAAGTNTKITYDAKGLVTKGEVAAITDIQGLSTVLNEKAPLESPVFTGTPKTIPINPLSAENSIVNKGYVDNEISKSKTAVVTQTITDGQTVTAPSENAVYDGLALKAPINSPAFTGVARTVTPTATSDIKTITTKEYVDASVAQVRTAVVSQSILLNNTTTAPSEDAVRKELDLKSPINSPVFTGIAKVPDITANSITDPLAITNKSYVDSQITSAGNIYTKDGTLTDNRKVTLNGKNLDFVGITATNPTRLAPDGTMTVGGNVNLNNKVAVPNAAINALQFTNDENGVGYAAASITAQTGADPDGKGKGQLSFKVKTAIGVDNEAVRITEKGNVLVGGTTDNSSAVLNVQSTTKGVLMPRQTEAQRKAISAPAQGLQVYQTAPSGTSLEGQYLNTSAGWKRILLEGEIKQDYFEAINTGGAISGSADTPVAVHINDVDASNNKKIAISDANASATARFDGVVIDNVAAGATCKVYLRYVSHNINTLAYTQNASVFLGAGGGFTHDPSTLPFGVRIGKAFSVSSPGSVLFSAYLVGDVLRNQFELTNTVTGIDETTFTGPVVSGSAPLGDNYLTNKRYVDETVASLQQYQGVWNAATNTPPLENSTIAKKGWTRDVTVASAGNASWPNLCPPPVTILKGDVIKFDGTCWVVLEKEFQSATTAQEGVVKLDAVISASTTLVPTSNLLKAVSDANQAHIANTSNPHSVTKTQVGLANVDNTSDTNKPVSVPQQTALNLKADKANGVAQITDSNPYTNIGTLAGVTQAAINAGINNRLGQIPPLNGTGLVRMAGSTVSYDNTAYAPLASPVFTGDAQAATPTFGDNDTSIATTSFVNRAAVDLWSKNGNNINDDTNFIGTINNKDLVFKAHNIERMRVDQSLGQVAIGTVSSPTSLRINTTTEGSKNIPLKITTNDPNPFIMSFEAFGSGPGTHYFDISSMVYDNTNFRYLPANISMLSEGGILSVGKDDFTGLSERLEVNGNVRAAGFKIPNGTSNQFLMADGSTSITGSVSSGWSLNGNSGTDQSTNFIGTTDDSDIVFRANNRERWRMGSDTGRLYVGALNDVNSAGSVYIIPEGGTTNSTPLTIKTADIDNSLTMEFQTHLSGASKYFNISTFIGDRSVPANLSLMSEGGILNLGHFDFTGLSEKLEVNGNVKATGFKIPSGTANQYLMADGSTSLFPASKEWSLTGNTGTIAGTNFIGNIDHQDIVFKTNNVEHWRMGADTGTLYVGDIIDPNSSGSLAIITNAAGENSTPFIIRTADNASPLVMSIQTINPTTPLVQPFFKISTKGENTIAGNLSLMPNEGITNSGGILNIGYDTFADLTEKVEVNGTVRADRFVKTRGLSNEILMADGSVSLLKSPWELTGNAGTNPVTDFIGTTDLNDLKFRTNNVQRLLVAANGGVFVNESAVAGYQFHVNGAVGGSQTWAVASDKRLKTNIQPVLNGLSSVMQMKPVTYDKKASLESKDYNISEIGFIAQDLKTLFPKAIVNEGQDKDKLLSVNYTELIPVLTNAIQEQQKIIDEEKAKNDKQQKEIDELKAMVKQLLEKK
jgi:hypothetical protein